MGRVYKVPEPMNTLEEQIIELQSRVTFQEDTLNELNEVLVAQNAQIDLLRQQLRALSEQYRDLKLQGHEPAADQPPPHY